MWRAAFSIEIDTNEGWNAYHVDDVIADHPLYPPKDELTINNYPPLSFYAVALLARWFGDPIYIGRVLSLMATLGLGGIVAFCVLKLGGGRAGAAVGGLWFVATMARFFTGYVGMNDPQLPALCVMTIALAWFLARDAERRSADAPVLLMVIAGFYKHNVIVIPATVLLWLFIRDWRRATRPIAVGIVAATGGLTVCVLIYGDAFIPNMLMPRVYSVERILRNIGHLQWVAPGVLLWAFWAWHARDRAEARFTSLFVGLGLLFYVLQLAAEGVGDNAQFDLVVATAIGLGVAFGQASLIADRRDDRVERVRFVIFTVVIARLLFSLRTEPFLVICSADYRALHRVHADLAQAEAARVAAIPGLVSCSNLLVCRMAGKPFVVDEFKLEMLRAIGLVTNAAIDAKLRARGITRITINDDAESSSLKRELSFSR
jgi:hypothetical protein